jgi:transposase-like protein
VKHRSSSLKRFPVELKSRIVDLARQGVPTHMLAQRMQLQPSQLQSWLRSEKQTGEISVFEDGGSWRMMLRLKLKMSYSASKQPAAPRSGKPSPYRCLLRTIGIQLSPSELIEKLIALIPGRFR